MIIKKDEKEKKSNSFSFVKFLYIYFFLSLVPIFFFAVAVFQSQLFINEKNKFLDYFSKAGRYEYLYLPNIIPR